jgi:hypothetical protein
MRYLPKVSGPKAVPGPRYFGSRDLKPGALRQCGRPAFTSSSLFPRRPLATAFRLFGYYFVRMSRSVYNKALCVGLTSGLVKLEYVGRDKKGRPEIEVDQVAICDIQEMRPIV